MRPNGIFRENEIIPDTHLYLCEPPFQKSWLPPLQVIKSILCMKIDFVLANSADSDEMLPYASFDLGVHCLPKLPFRASGLQRVKL